MCSECGQTPCVTRCPNHIEKIVDTCSCCYENIYANEKYYFIKDNTYCESCYGKKLIEISAQEDFDEFIKNEKIKDIAQWIRQIVISLSDAEVVESLSFLFNTEERKAYCMESDTAFIEWRIENG